jgi:hypothetical protein
LTGLGLIVVIAIIGAAAGGKGKPPKPTSSGAAPPESHAASPSRPRARGKSSAPHTKPCRESGAVGTEVAVGKDTSCPFAGEVLKAYAGAVGREAPEGGQRQAIEAWSPVTHRQYAMRCLVTQDGEGDGHLVVCRGGKGAVVTFPAVSVTRVQAQPEPEAPEEAEEPEGAEAGGAEGASEPESSEGGEGGDEVGSPSHAGDQQFCAEHVCIGKFTEEDGNVAECEDGTFSHAGGIQGACSDHGGVLRE